MLRALEDIFCEQLVRFAGTPELSGAAAVGCRTAGFSGRSYTGTD